jgi:transmembrane sensor
VIRRPVERALVAALGDRHPEIRFDLHGVRTTTAGAGAIRPTLLHFFRNLRGRCSQAWLRFLFGERPDASTAVCLRAPLGAAIGGACILLSAAAPTLFPRTFHYPASSTEIGEIRVVELSDGVVATLNTDSRLRWIGAGIGRHVEVVQGEVLFDVKHDAVRPFRVVVAHTEILDLGTSFSVYRESDGNVAVTVVEGTIEIVGLKAKGNPSSASRRLSANERIEYTPEGVVLAESDQSVDVQDLLSWRDGIVTATRMPLRRLVAEFNRYTTKPIRVVDRRLDEAHIVIGGAFSVRDVREGLRALHATAPVVVTETPTAFLLTYGAIDVP